MATRTRQKRAPAGGVPAGPLPLRALADAVTWFVAPTSFVAALALWFGLTFTNARSTYFGVDHSALGYSSQDYVLRSADAIFVPLMVLLLVVLAGTAVHGVAVTLAARRTLRPQVRRGALVAAAVGAAGGTVGVDAMFRPLPVDWYLLPPLLLGGGTALSAYGAWLAHQVRGPGVGQARPSPVSPAHRLAAVTVAFVVLLSTFWAASLYAAALGRGRAVALARGLDSRPAVTVYSDKSLAVVAPGVIDESLTGADTAFHHRYRGLRLLVFSGGKYFLVTEGWTPERGEVLVLEDGPGMRVEFEPGGRP